MDSSAPAAAGLAVPRSDSARGRAGSSGHGDERPAIASSGSLTSEPQLDRPGLEKRRLSQLPPYWRDPASLRHVNAIQGHGVLLALETDTAAGGSPVVRRVSANLLEMAGVDADSALGGPLSAVLQPESMAAVVGAIARYQFAVRTDGASSPVPGGAGAAPVELLIATANGVEWMGLLHFPGGRAGREAVLELEPVYPSTVPAGALGAPTDELAGLSARSMLCAEEATSVEVLVRQLIDEANDIVRFDRCMIYRFDASGDGEVVAESLKDTSRGSFLGMSFPGMDIPPAARELFLLNRFRSIPDVNADPVPILSAPDEPPLDLARSSLRSVSQCHLQYLKHMGVQATIVNAIVVSGNMWGLFVCHNYSPKHCDRRLRLACNNFVMVLSSQISYVLEKQYRRHETRARELHGLILESARDSAMARTFTEALFNCSPNVKDLLPCAGVALLVLNGPGPAAAAAAALAEDESQATVNTLGHVPSTKDLLALGSFLERACEEKARRGEPEVVHTNCWGRHMPARVAPPAGLCGFLGVRLSPGAYVMYFREEVSLVRQWAGREQDLTSPARHLTPRESFELWVEYTKGHSEQFAPGDIASVDVLKSVWNLNEKLGISRQLKLVSQDLRQLMEAVTVPIVTLSRELRVVDWNPRAEELFGLTRASVLGQDFVDAMVSEMQANEARGVLLAAAVGKAIGSREFEFTTRSRDHAHQPMEILMRAVTRLDPQGGGVCGVCCICTDLTERKSKLKAEIRAEETRKFLATMSHEMRTPLNGVLGMLQLAKDYPMHPAARDYVDGAMRSGEHLLNLINDILDINRIEAGKMTLDSVRFNVARSVNAAVMVVQPKATAKAINIRVDVSNRLPDVCGDPERLQQILLNYLSNGVKFTPEGGNLVVRAYPRCHKGNNVEVVFEVEDDGFGIRAEDQPQLFQRFFRVLDRTRQDPGGTGLGLAICKEIATRWGGTVGVKSAPGTGSTFWVVLPLEVAPPALAPPSPLGMSGLSALGFGRPRKSSAVSSEGGQESPRSNAESLGEPGDGSRSRRRYSSPLVKAEPEPEAGAGPGWEELQLPGAVRRTRRASSAGCDTVLNFSDQYGQPLNQPASQPARILVAEDNQINMRIVKAMLEKAGHTVTVAGDGQEAVDEFVRAVNRIHAAHSPQPLSGEPPAPGAGPAPRPAKLRAFDVILMDFEMPTKDGLTATREIRAIEAASGICRHPIVALTASVLPEDERRCLQAGMDAHLHKPIVRSQLLATIAQFRAAVPLDADPPDEAPPAPVLLPRPTRQAGEPLSPAAAPSAPAPPPAPAAAPAPAPPALRVTGPEPRPREQLRPEEVVLDVLVAEDNPINMKVLCAMLENVGWRATRAKDGVEAAEVFEARARQRLQEVKDKGGSSAHAFTVVCMDCEMPRMNGYEATQRIRAIEAELGLPRHPVIAVTAFAANADDRAKCLQAGMDDYSTKPVKRDKLFRLLLDWISSLEVHVEKRPAPPPPAAPAATPASAQGGDANSKP